MVTIEVKLEYVLANPWQPRENEDPEHIKNLAISIFQQGLMQVPVGRWVNPAGKFAPDVERGNPIDMLVEAGFRVQLAFGHSRLAAYKYLQEQGKRGFSLFPVVTRELSDEDMFRMGVSENVQRRDLSPIEEARAMVRYRDEFGKSSAEIGDLFGLAESSVRNKMRLLGLPAEIQEAASKGTISEGAARELLAFYEMPAWLQKEGENVAYSQGNGMTRTSVVKMALNGVPADQVREVITALVRQNGRELSGAKWKWDAAYDKCLDVRIVNETCKDCSIRIQRDKNWYCLSRDCWKAREEIGVKAMLALARAATGIRPAEELGRGAYDYVRLEEEAAAEIRASGCDHLRLVASDSFSTMRKGMMVEGHPGIVVMCDKKNGQCTCANGIAARAKLKSAGIRVEQPVSGKPAEIRMAADSKEKTDAGQLPASNESLKQMKVGNADELKDLASQARRAAKQMREEVKAMQEDFAHRVVAAFENRNARVMAELLLGFVYSTERYKFAKASAEEVLYKAALHFSEAKYDLNYYTTPDLGVAMDRFNDFLKEADLGVMQSHLYEPEPEYVAVEDAQPAESMVLGWEKRDPSTGRTVVDVFSEGNAADHFPGQQPGETLMDYFARTDGQGA